MPVLFGQKKLSARNFLPLFITAHKMLLSSASAVAVELLPHF
jgi:hypothetical protein